MTIRSQSIALAAIAALVTAPAFAQDNSGCSTTGEHRWIIPDSVFSANAYGSARGTYGQSLEQLFAPYGVTISSQPVDTISLVDERNVYGGGAVDTSLIWNLIGGRPDGAPDMNDLLLQSAGNHPANFTLRFDRPVLVIRFIRAGLIPGGNGITHPEWSAVGYDAQGDQVAIQREGLIASYAGVPAKVFTLEGARPISSVTFYGDNHAFAAFTNLALQLVAWCR